MNAIIKLPYPRSGDSQGQETFLVTSADKQTRNYDTRVLKPPSLPINPNIQIYLYVSTGIDINQSQAVIL